MIRDDCPPALALLAGTQAQVRYVIARDLSGESGQALESARQASLASPFVRSLLAELEAWPGKALASHKSPEQAFHKLALAAEFGLRREDPGASALAERVMAHVSEEGPFSLPMAIGEGHGGTGKETDAWALCDAPVTLRALVRMGYAGDPRVGRAIAFLEGLSLAQGWPCAASASLGSWRGPGRKGDPCPYATLAMTELLLDAPDSDTAAASAVRGERPASRAALAREGALALLALWENSRTLHPYIFHMGTDFRKLKVPLHWYDLLHVLDVLSRVPGLGMDPRLLDMASVLRAKRGADGLFTPESVYQKWKSEDFGQKKAPSAYLSAVALRVLKRLDT